MGATYALLRQLNFHGCPLGGGDHRPFQLYDLALFFEKIQLYDPVPVAHGKWDENTKKLMVELKWSTIPPEMAAVES